MSTYTEFHNKAGENLQIRNNPGKEDDRVSNLKVKLFNEDNEYLGTFQKYDNLINQLSGNSFISSEALSIAIRELIQDVSISAHNLSNEVKIETRLRTESNAVISSSLSVISTDILINIDELSMNLSTEILNLSGNLSSEIKTLSTNLSINIVTLSTRLSIEINNLSSNSSTNISSLSSRLSSEIQTLSSSLSLGISNLSTCLSSTIENISTNLSHDIADLSDHLSSEIVRLSTMLSSNIYNLSSDLSAEIAALSMNLSIEVNAKGYVTPFDYSFRYIDHEIILSIWNANGQAVSSSINTAKFEEGRLLSSVDRIKEDGKWYLRLVFKLEDKSIKEVKIPLTDFLEIYKSGPGISIDLPTLIISADETIARLSDVNNQDNILCSLILHNTSSINIIHAEVIPSLSNKISSNDVDTGFLSSLISSNFNHTIFISSEVSANGNDILFLSNAISVLIEYIDDKFKTYTSAISSTLSAIDKLSALTTNSVLEDIAQGVCNIRDMLSSLVITLKLVS